MGRRKIAIEPIEDDRNRHVTFNKRKNGLFKKAMELSILCKSQISLVIFNSDNQLFEYCSTDPRFILQRYCQVAHLPHERLSNEDYDIKYNKGKNKKKKTESSSASVASSSSASSASGTPSGAAIVNESSSSGSSDVSSADDTQTLVKNELNTSQGRVDGPQPDTVLQDSINTFLNQKNDTHTPGNSAHDLSALASNLFSGMAPLSASDITPRTQAVINNLAFGTNHPLTPLTPGTMEAMNTIISSVSDSDNTMKQPQPQLQQQQQAVTGSNSSEEVITTDERTQNSSTKKQQKRNRSDLDSTSTTSSPLHPDDEDSAVSEKDVGRSKPLAPPKSKRRKSSNQNLTIELPANRPQIPMKRIDSESGTPESNTDSPMRETETNNSSNGSALDGESAAAAESKSGDLASVADVAMLVASLDSHNRKEFTPLRYLHSPNRDSVRDQPQSSSAKQDSPMSLSR